VIERKQQVNTLIFGRDKEVDDDCFYYHSGRNDKGPTPCMRSYPPPYPRSSAPPKPFPPMFSLFFPSPTSGPRPPGSAPLSRVIGRAACQSGASDLQNLLNNLGLCSTARDAGHWLVMCFSSPSVGPAAGRHSWHSLSL